MAPPGVVQKMPVMCLLFLKRAETLGCVTKDLGGRSLLSEGRQFATVRQRPRLQAGSAEMVVPAGLAAVALGDRGDGGINNRLILRVGVRCAPP